MGRIAAIGAVAATAIVLAGTALGAKHTEIPLPNLTVDLAVEFTPKQLPRRERAPVGISISAELSTRDGAREPPLREAVLETDRNTSLDVTGLPACGRRKLRRLNTATVEAACRDALVGNGLIKATVAYPENSPIPVSTELLVFNGGFKGRMTTFFARMAIGQPLNETVIGTLRVKRIGKVGGLRGILTIPPFADDYGSLTGFDLRLGRSYTYEGRKRSVFNARCANGTLLSGTTLTFADGTNASFGLFNVCKAANRSP